MESNRTGEHSSGGHKIAQQDWWQRLSDRERKRLSEERRSFSRALFDGKMRALSDFLDDLPDVRKALKGLLAIEPRFGVSGNAVSKAA